jgi:ankyrin repeat protein
MTMACRRPPPPPPHCCSSHLVHTLLQHQSCQYILLVPFTHSHRSTLTYSLIIIIMLLSALPPELLVTILCLLRNERDVYHTSRVCRLLHRLCHAPVVWHAICEHKYHCGSCHHTTDISQLTSSSLLPTLTIPWPLHVRVVGTLLSNAELRQICLDALAQPTGSLRHYFTSIARSDASNHHCRESPDNVAWWCEPSTAIDQLIVSRSSDVRQLEIVCLVEHGFFDQQLLPRTSTTLPTTTAPSPSLPAPTTTTTTTTTTTASLNHMAATPDLMLAVNYNLIHLTRSLLLLNFDPNIANDCQDRPLHWAARKNRAAIAQLLLQHRADVNVLNSFNRSPLHRACKDGHIDVALMLLEANADPNTAIHASSMPYDSQTSPLHNAVRANCFQLVLSLIQHNADANVLDANNCLPLHHLTVDGSNAQNDYRIASLLLPVTTPAAPPTAPPSTPTTTTATTTTKTCTASPTTINVATHVARVLAHYGDATPLDAAANSSKHCTTTPPATTTLPESNSNSNKPFELFCSLVSSAAVDLNVACTPCNDTIMHLCAASMSDDTMAWLRSLGGRMDIQNSNGRTPDQCRPKRTTKRAHAVRRLLSFSSKK